MTWRPSEEEMKMMRETSKWMYIDDDGNNVLKEDAPKEIKEFHEYMRKMYSRFD